MHVRPIIGAFAMRISLSHPSAAFPRQPVTDFALRS